MQKVRQMVSKYISREEIDRVLSNRISMNDKCLSGAKENKQFEEEKYFFTLIFEDEQIKDLIEGLPPADVRPNIHAAWEDTADPIDSRWGRKYYQCPKCSKRADYFMGGSEDWWCVDKPNFCPSCGAIMDGEPIGEKGTE